MADKEPTKAEIQLELDALKGEVAAKDEELKALRSDNGLKVEEVEAVKKQLADAQAAAKAVIEDNEQIQEVVEDLKVQIKQLKATTATAVVRSRKAQPRTIQNSGPNGMFEIKGF